MWKIEIFFNHFSCCMWIHHIRYNIYQKKSCKKSWCSLIATSWIVLNYFVDSKHILSLCSSTGVVLTLAIPAVSSGTGAGTLKSPLVPMGSAHGHTGHVRFLTSIELPEGFDMNFPLPTTDSSGFCRLFKTFVSAINTLLLCISNSECLVVL